MRRINALGAAAVGVATVGLAIGALTAGGAASAAPAAKPTPSPSPSASPPPVTSTVEKWSHTVTLAPGADDTWAPTMTADQRVDGWWVEAVNPVDQNPHPDPLIAVPRCGPTYGVGQSRSVNGGLGTDLGNLAFSCTMHNNDAFTTIQARLHILVVSGPEVEH